MIKILELFNNPVPFRVDHTRKDVFEAHFIVKDVSYTFFAVSPSANPNKKGWDIVFRLDSKSQVKGLSHYGITNTGNSVIVFSTVASILKLFLKDYKPEKFQFDAEGEPSRFKLYALFAHEISKLDPHYELSKIKRMESITVFLFRRK